MSTSSWKKFIQTHNQFNIQYSQGLSSKTSREAGRASPVQCRIIWKALTPHLCWQCNYRIKESSRYHDFNDKRNQFWTYSNGKPRKSQNRRGHLNFRKLNQSDQSRPCRRRQSLLKRCQDCRFGRKSFEVIRKFPNFR